MIIITCTWNYCNMIMMMSTESLFYCDSYVCLDIWSKFILSIIYKFQWYKQKITNVFQLKLISEKMQKKPTKKQVLFISIFFFFITGRNMRATCSRNPRNSPWTHRLHHLKCCNTSSLVLSVLKGLYSCLFNSINI